MILKAYAKLNLGLKILGKRPDGYHNIETILQKIGLFDEIELTKKANGIELSSNLPPYGDKNLCWKAANLFFTQLNLKTGIRIKLKKRIWLGAGLGGGSSDAAQTLLGINKLYGNPLESDEIFKIALKLGSDVPFFIKNGPALIEGRGEIITQLPALKEPIWFALVYPKFQVSTQLAYKSIKNYLTTPEWEFKIIRNAFLNNNIRDLAKNLHNDFEPIVFNAYPELQRTKKKLLELGVLGASLSGSGSCVYGILDVKQPFRIDKLEEEFSRGLPNFDFKVIRSI